MTRRGSRLVDEFDERAASCSTGGELEAVLDAAVRELGFDHFAVVHHAGLARRAANLIRLANYPASWIREIAEQGFTADDPVHLASARCNAAFCWAEIGGVMRLRPRHHDIFARGRRHGIGPGFTVPANVPGEPRGSSSFAVRPGRTFPVGRLHAAELIGAHAFAAARRLHGYPDMTAPPHLSRRELECLRLVARGKTAWEIGRLLGIAEATAKQYVNRARAGYGVASRTQLVVHGLRDGWIAFDDAIPPGGGMV